MADLETRIKLVEDIEAIKSLKARYWLCMDEKRYEEMPRCFAEDAVMEIVDRQVHREGRRVIVDGIRETLGKADVRTINHGYAVEIQVSGNVATAKWAFQDIIIGREKNGVFKSWGYYDDEYRREAQGWVIAKSVITRRYAESSFTVGQI